MKKVRTLFFLLSLLVPALCSAQESKAASNATNCFYRAHRYEGAALKPPVYVDEIEIARLKNGQSVQVIIPPGVHKAYSNDSSTKDTAPPSTPAATAAPTSPLSK